MLDMLSIRNFLLRSGGVGRWGGGGGGWVGG